MYTVAGSATPGIMRPIKNTPSAIPGILDEKYSKLPELWAAKIHGKIVHLRACLAQVIRSDTLVLNDVHVSGLEAPGSSGLHRAARHDFTIDVVSD